MTDLRVKYLAASLLLLSWFILVLLHIVPVDGLIAAITGILSGMGVYHTTITDPRKADDPTVKPEGV